MNDLISKHSQSSKNTIAIQKDHSARQPRLLLITGCGRSGTLYASELWRAVGLDVRHERPVPPNGVVGKDGIASWFMAVDDPNPPYGPSVLRYHFKWVIHQVREPLKSIASIAQFIFRGKRPWYYVVRNIPAIGEGLPSHDKLRESRSLLLHGAMRYWLMWNKLVECKADCTIQVERLTENVPKLCELMKITANTANFNNISKKTNQRELYIKNQIWQVTWQELEVIDLTLTYEIRELARRYGYSS